METRERLIRASGRDWLLAVLCTQGSRSCVTRYLPSTYRRNKYSSYVCLPTTKPPLQYHGKLPYRSLYHPHCSRTLPVHSPTGLGSDEMRIWRNDFTITRRSSFVWRYTILRSKKTAAQPASYSTRNIQHASQQATSQNLPSSSTKPNPKNQLTYTHSDIPIYLYTYILIYQQKTAKT